MAPETSPSSQTAEESVASADPGGVVPDEVPPAPRGPFTLAALLELNDADLAQPLSRAAPEEHRWEQLSIGAAPDTGHAVATSLRTGAASEPPSATTELVPGLSVPGAVEVPVYLAGRTLLELMRAPADEDAAAPDVRPPAIVVAAVGRRRARMEAPVANFATAGSAAVLWPKRRKPVTATALPQECAKCGAPFDGERCTRCDHDVAVSSRALRSGRWNDVSAAFLESDSRVVRTIGALVLAPGELTSAHFRGRHRRYFGPTSVAIATLLCFAVISGLGGLRPRPDRMLTIGTERTAESLAGLVDEATVNLAVDSPPDLFRDVASALDYLPLLWLPLMAFGVVAVVASLRTHDRRDDNIELVFTTHFAAWFVVWWGFVVPSALLVTKFGLEYVATVVGVTRVRYLENGQLDGLPALWNTLRSLSLAPGFHSALLAIGLLPWAIIAHRRAFDSTWPRAALAGGLVVAVPLFLLLPFA